MKGSRNESVRQSKQNMSNRPVSAERDQLDSRDNLEFNDRPAGHNRKETKAGKQRKK